MEEKKVKTISEQLINRPNTTFAGKNIFLWLTAVEGISRSLAGNLSVYAYGAHHMIMKDEAEEFLDAYNKFLKR